MNNTKWTKYELGLLSVWYPTKGVRGVQGLIKRTSGAIRCKATRLGLFCDKPLNQYPNWEIDETEFLQKWYKSKGPDWCAGKLSRSKPAISHKAQILNLKYDRPYEGKNNGNWQGGITAEYQKIRNSEEYNQWRLQVFNRDGFKCASCEKPGKGIHAHHIKSFSEYPELRLDIDNGVTLCKKCHAELHNMPVLLT